MITIEMSREEARENQYYRDIPVALMDGLYRYVEQRIAPGLFLNAVLSHQLFESVFYADESALPQLHPLVMFIHNYVPAACHGSLERVAKWLK